MPSHSNHSGKRRRVPLVRRPITHWARKTLDFYPKLLVLEYHRVLDTPLDNPFDTIISTETFQTQLEYLTDRFPIVPLGAVDQQGETQVALTFDDGYEDACRTVLPILSRKRLPATFFLPANFIDSGGPLWDWEVAMRVGGGSGIEKVELDGVTVSRKSGESRISYARRVIEHLKGASVPVLQRVFETLRARSEQEDDARCMTWQEVKALIEVGLEVGSHGSTHRSLTRIPIMEAVDEIATSKRIVEAHTGQMCKYFAFPFGGKGDFNDLLVSRAHEAGFDRCFVNVRGYNRLTQQETYLRRVMVTEETDFRYLLG